MINLSLIEPKPGMDVGRVEVELTVQNYNDLARLQEGEIALSEVRTIVVAALVDSGATYLCLPHSLIECLGLTRRRTKKTTTANGVVELGLYSPVHLAVQGRDCISEVMELAEGCPALLGQLPLEATDWWIDPTSRALIGNPRHGEEWMAEAF